MSYEQMPTPKKAEGGESLETPQKYAVVDRTTGLVETYDTPEEAADAKERMQDPEYSN